MTSHDLLMVLTLSVPLILFTVWPGIMLGNYLESKSLVSETQKRAVIIVVMIIFALIGAAFMHFAKFNF